MADAAHLTELATLPASTPGFFPPETDWFASRPWFDLLADHAAPPNHHATIATLPGGGIVPLWRRGTKLIGGMTSPYTIRFAPTLTDPARDGTAFAHLLHHHGALPTRLAGTILRLDALDETAPALATFLDSLATAGIAAQHFGHFGNWWAPVGTSDFPTWLATRPGALRSTVTRKLKRARTEAEFTFIESGPALELGIAAFETVYAKSWKDAEPYPTFNAACMRALAAAGLLRLGILRTETGPVAAQYWAISGGQAMLLKLAHDVSATALSPGTVLTARMIEAILARDHPAALDFGRGDDPYKAQWVDQRRQRTGVLLYNPNRPAGLVLRARETLAQFRRHRTEKAA